MVDCKDVDSDTSNRGEPNGERSAPAKVLVPIVGSRVEQPSHLPADAVQPGDIRSLMPIAAPARQRKVLERVIAAMLASNHVLDLKSKSPYRLWQQAVFARIASPGPDSGGDFCVHRESQMVRVE